MWIWGKLLNYCTEFHVSKMHWVNRTTQCIWVGLLLWKVRTESMCCFCQRKVFRLDSDNRTRVVLFVILTTFGWLMTFLVVRKLRKINLDMEKSYVVFFATFYLYILVFNRKFQVIQIMFSVVRSCEFHWWWRYTFSNTSQNGKVWSHLMQQRFHRRVQGQYNASGREHSEHTVTTCSVKAPQDAQLHDVA